MTTKRRTSALITRSVALNIGARAYTQAFERFDADEPLHALEAVKAAQTGLDVLTRQAVAQARQTGATWQQVADSLGLNSKQAAQARYGD
jgi:uncharacterized NAD(P)/FAD-binding protein YdhS